MAPSHRPVRILAALLLLLCTVLVLQHLKTVPSHEASYPPLDLSKIDHGGEIVDETFGDAKPVAGFSGVDVIVQPAQDQNAEKPPPGSDEDIAVDAHRLPTADSFLLHFKALSREPSLSVEDAKSGCQWPAINEVNFQFEEVNYEWVKHDPSENEVGKRRQQWLEFVENKLLPYEEYKDRFNGRGIVIVAGNAQSMKRVKVILNALKKLGSNMPIELHYWADEMSEKSKQEISSLWSEMYFNDLSALSNILKTDHDGPFINYQLKTAAVVNSRFAEPLLLDSDNIPVIDPSSLYESSIYQEYGTLFWPDIAHTRPNNPVWSITNTRCRTDEYEQESGQLVVDKNRFFYHLQLAAWFNNEQGEYYNQYLLGDKDTFRFAWHALKTKYGSPPKWLTSVGTLADNGFYCGHSFAQYHPDGRVAFLHGGLVKTMAKEVMRWQRQSRGGIFQAFKRSDYDQQHFVNVDVSIKADTADYLPNRPADIEVAMCTDFHQVTARPLDELIPNFEKTFEEIGGYWMLDR